MNIPFFCKNNFLSKEEIKHIQEAIGIAEKKTSSEIRLFIEPKTNNKDPLERAKEIFYQHKMFNTKQKNGILIYLAHKDRKVAIYGDEGIHQKVGDNYWQEEINTLITFLKKEEHKNGLINIILHVGKELKQFFPYDDKTDTNELSNEIIFN